MSRAHTSQTAEPQRQAESARRAPVPRAAGTQSAPFASLLQLQRSAGNRAVIRLLRNGSDEILQPPAVPSIPIPILQRKCACGGVATEGGECSACRKKR